MVDEVRLDFDRQNRTGLGEAVMCCNKTHRQLLTILDQVVAAGKAMLFTRLDVDAYALLDPQGRVLDYDEVSGTAIYRPDKQAASQAAPAGDIAVVTGGTSDISVAGEALRTLEFYGRLATPIHDIGVAGLWRLQDQLPVLRDKKVIICVAGMDAALPTVIGGLVPGLIIAVPSSVGYGVAHQGETALHALLCSCAQGMVVVNIDNGFGAACAALRALPI